MTESPGGGNDAELKNFKSHLKETLLLPLSKSNISSRAIT
jgi:hypothetical protein